MTWNPLKKNYLTQRPTSAPPLLSYAEDKELDVVVQKLIYVESAIRKLIKEMKKYIGALTNLDRADQRLSTNLINCGLAQNNDECRRIVEEYYSVATQVKYDINVLPQDIGHIQQNVYFVMKVSSLVGKNVQEISNLCHKTFIEPLKKFRNEFITIAAAIAKREDLVTTWKYVYNRVKKLQEKKDKTANHIAKLERERRAEETAAKELKTIHAQLLTELPTFLGKRLEYINPSIHAVIMIQLNYYGHATQLYTQLMPIKYSSEFTSSTIVPEEEHQRVINTELNRLRALTIVKDH